ncbi:B-cell antigen receptor complex-associated protein alpha chain-like [Narcine bancroftii]|uniref:B-cell antigen receptor complex-associated protein alpha chain-like n=1 Tax=Narcine bancroftii TaxID=1343680 RepID=UPI003831A5AC
MSPGCQHPCQTESHATRDRTTRAPVSEMMSAIRLLLLSAALILGQGLEVPAPSVRVELGTGLRLPCALGSGRDHTWERRLYNGTSWEPVPSQDGKLTLDRVWLTDLGIYRCRSPHNQTSCEIGLRVYRVQSSHLFNLKESEKDFILIVEGILLLSCVVLPGTVLLRQKSQRSLREKIQQYKENENLYQGLNQEDQATYEDITRGQQSMYEDVANFRYSSIDLEKP